MSDIQKYIKAIRKRMACSCIQKNQFLQDFEMAVCQFQTETNASYEQLISHFGTPEQIADEFMETLGLEAINRYQRRRRNTLILVIVFLTVILFSLGYAIYYFYTGTGDESKSEITTTIYEPEPTPENFLEEK